MSVARDRAALRRRHSARDVRRHADRVCARRGRDRLHDLLHAACVARYHHAERLRGDGVDHAALDSAVHPQGRGDRPLARRRRIFILRCMCGCTAFPAALVSPTCSPARLFAAMAGSSPATCSAIGSAGIPEMRKRGYSPGFASGIIAAGGTLGILLPPSITMILYAVAAEQSLGRLFLAGIGPGLLLVGLFAIYATFRYAAERRDRRTRLCERTARTSSLLREERYTLREEFADAAARPAIRHAADRRDDRALRRLCHAVGDGRPGRGPRAGPDRNHLLRLEAERPAADPRRDAARIDHADVDHRHVAPLLLRDELPAHQRNRRRRAIVAACISRAGCCSR